MSARPPGFGAGFDCRLPQKLATSSSLACFQHGTAASTPTTGKMSILQFELRPPAGIFSPASPITAGEQPQGYLEDHPGDSCPAVIGAGFAPPPATFQQTS